MFIRKLKNKSGSISVQIISEESQKYKVVKTIGSSKTEEEINSLLYQAKHELDKLNNSLKGRVEQLSFEHTRKLLNNKQSVVFYDMTTLYFESSDEDDLRKTGFSKDGKHQNSQIFLGLLVGLGGYAMDRRY